jgi:hypothetical protein
MALAVNHIMSRNIVVSIENELFLPFSGLQMPSQTGVKITSDLPQSNIVGKTIKKLHTSSKDTHSTCDIIYYLYKLNIANS